MSGPTLVAGVCWSLALVGRRKRALAIIFSQQDFGGRACFQRRRSHRPSPTMQSKALPRRLPKERATITRFAELNTELEQIAVAESLSRNHGDRADHHRTAWARQFAAPFQDLADNRPRALATRREELEYEISKLRPGYMQACENYRIACSRGHRASRERFNRASVRPCLLSPRRVKAFRGQWPPSVRFTLNLLQPRQIRLAHFSRCARPIWAASIIGILN